MPNAKRRVPSAITDEEEAAIQAGIARDPDNPELTETDFSSMRPAREVLAPALFEALAKRRPGQRGPGRRRPKVAVTLRLDVEVLEAFKSEGEGWQTRINETLKKAVGK